MLRHINLSRIRYGLFGVPSRFTVYIGCMYCEYCVLYTTCVRSIENRIYIRGEFKESLGLNFFSPFQPEMEFKVYKSCKCSQIICSTLIQYVP